VDGFNYLLYIRIPYQFKHIINIITLLCINCLIYKYNKSTVSNHSVIINVIKRIYK